jgi:hypothetical protein
MKTLLVVFSLICAAIAAPMTISDNNIGDIRQISIHANGVVSTNVEAYIAQFLGALKNQQAVVAGDLPMDIAPTNDVEDVNLSPEVMSEVQKFISPEMLTGIAKAFSSK